MHGYKKYICCFIMTLLTVCKQQLSAQNIENMVMIEGQIFSNNKSVSDVYVQNKRVNTVTISDDQGKFFIAAKIKDTLTFSNIAYTTKTMVITKYNYNQKFVVLLEPVNNQLEEVHVKNNDLSGYIDVDISNIPKENKLRNVSAKTLKLPFADYPRKTTFEYKIHALEEHGGILFAVINAISGRTRRNNKIKKILLDDFNMKQMFAIYTNAEYSQMLNTPLNEVDAFLIFCKHDDTFKQLFKQQNEIKILAYFIQKSKAFKQLKKE